MEFQKLNKSMYEEMFGSELDVTEETPDPFETDKSQVPGLASRAEREAVGDP